MQAAVGIRELSRNVTQIVDAVEKTGKPVLVTRHGRPVAILMHFNEDALPDVILEHSDVLTGPTTVGAESE